MKTDLTEPILIIEDSDEDFAAIVRIMRKSSIDIPLYRCTDGDQGLDFLYRTGEYADPKTAPRPALILLDLNLPGTDGRDVIFGNQAR